MSFYKNIISKKSKTFILIFSFAMVGILTLPWPIHTPRTGLDPSWCIGMYKALLDNLQFGPEITFTFGPLGFLYLPFFVDPTLWSISFLFNLLAHFVFLFSIALLMYKTSCSWKEYMIILPILLFSINSTIAVIGTHMDYILIMSSIILLYLIIEDKVNQKYVKTLLLLVSLLLAISSFIKFSMAIASISVLAMFFIISIFKKQIKDFLILSFLYILLILILWLITGQHLENLPTYLFNSFQISSGYNYGMALDGPKWQLLVGLTGLIFMIFMLAYSLIKKIDDLIIFIFLSIGFLFLAFKHGFVRQDAHVQLFFFPFIIIVTCIYIICKKNGIPKIRLLALFFSVFFLISVFFSFPKMMERDLFERFPAYKLSFSLISDEAYKGQLLESYKNNVRNNYPLDSEVLQYLNNKKVDVFPWDIALIWAYDLKWSPRPIIQSQNVYTSYLDIINRNHFENYAPETIMYSYKSIDGKYPAFDEPATFRKVLCTYTFHQKTDEFLILSFNPKERTCAIEEDLGSSTREIGQIISIPEYKSGYLFAYVYLDYSFVGKIMNFIYKSPPIYIKLKFKDGASSYKYRFFPDTAKNGIFLSQFVSDTIDLTSVFQGELFDELEGMTFETDSPLYYSKIIKIRFSGVPAKVSTKNRYTLAHFIKSVNVHPSQTYILGNSNLKGDTRSVIYEHPMPDDKSMITFKNLKIPENAVLRFGLGLDSQVWSSDKGDGVLYEIYVIEYRSKKLLFSKYIDPKNNQKDRRWHDFEIDLSEYANRNVMFLFVTSCGPNNDCNYDWAYWSNPTIIFTNNEQLNPARRRLTRAEPNSSFPLTKALII